MPANIRVSVDSDFAADRAPRKKTIGMVQRLARLPIKTTSNLQTSAGNLSECEFYVLVHGAAHGLGLQAYMRDLGINLLFRLSSQQFEYESVREPARLGQATPCSNTLLVDPRHGCSKVPTADNISDILTKAVDFEALEGFRGSASEKVTQTILKQRSGHEIGDADSAAREHPTTVSISVVSNRAAANTHVRTHSHSHISDAIIGHTLERS